MENDVGRMNNNNSNLYLEALNTHGHFKKIKKKIKQMQSRNRQAADCKNKAQNILNK